MTDVIEIRLRIEPILRLRRGDGLVIVAGHIHGLGEPVGQGFIIMHASRNRARWVRAMKQLREMTRAFVIVVLLRLLFDFVAGTPEDDAGMIAVAMDKVCHVTLVPGVVIKMIVVRRLAFLPAIEQFIHHHEPHAVAQIEQLRCGRIVRSADGVAAHRAENLQLPLCRALVEGHAQRAKVAVVADALQFEHVTVEEESLFRVPLNLADAERRFNAIHLLTAC